MTVYTVSWTIDVEADSPEEAVHNVAQGFFAQHVADGEPDCATCFEVGVHGSNDTETIDIACPYDD